MSAIVQDRFWGARCGLIARRTDVLRGADGQPLREVERMIQPGRPVRDQARGVGQVTSEHSDLREAMGAADASVR